MCRRRHCLTRETLSHPADSLSGRADNVWQGRQCLTWHTASVAAAEAAEAAAAGAAAGAAAAAAAAALADLLEG